MRLIVLNDHGFINGGGAQVAISSLNALAETGIDVTFVSCVGPVDPSINVNLVKIINFNQFDLKGNPSKLQAGIRGIWNTKSSELFGNLLEDYDPKDTIIHLHTWVSSLSSSVTSVAIKRGFKVVCTLHDYSSVCPNSGLYNFNKAQNCELKPLSFSCICSNCDSRSYLHKLWRVSRQVVQNNIANFQKDIHLFISVSKYSENLLRKYLPDSAEFENIGNPIPIDKECPIDVGENKDFTFIGRLSLEKGGILFAQAAKIAKVNPVFVGSGNEENRINDTNSMSIFKGWQDRKGVIDSIRKSRAIVFPSLLHEAQPLIVLEAAALGVPVIASDECAAKDSIVDGITGLLFRSRDPIDLSKKIELLNSDIVLARKLAKNAFENYWESPSTMEVHVNKLIRCYEKVLIQ
jgi:glycosyltransferase involved in cell wall biosynthesis